MESGLILPPGVDLPARAEPQRGVVVNETDLPDYIVENAVTHYLDEHASLLGVSPGSQVRTYGGQAGGGMLARAKFRPPNTIFDEMTLARDLAERDDDCGPAIGSMIAIAYSEGMEHTHEDEATVELFNEIAANTNLDQTHTEFYRELLITGQLNTVSAFTREDFTIRLPSGERSRTRSVAAPLIGVLPAELIRVLDNDLFGTGTLAYLPATGEQEKWLMEYFSSDTTPAKKAELRAMDPVLAAMVTSEVIIKRPDLTFHPDVTDPPTGTRLYRLNPRMVHRSTLAKGAWKYPRPLLTRNFALLEAKRLLNIMDYALLEGGSNFLVVAKKGSKEQPAHPNELRNLSETLGRSSRAGVLVGDHRLDIEIITPDLTELLNADKRLMLGRKLANGLLRVPVQDEDAGGEGMKARLEMIARVITLDRLLIKRHLARGPYRETVTRNPSLFTQGPADVWFPKIILSGTQYFTDYVLKMRDRGDISRRTAVKAGGFDVDSEVQQRKREKSRGDDRVMEQPNVPFTGNGPQISDNGGGRPAGAKDGSSNGPARARPRRKIARLRGETVVARLDDEAGAWRVGEQTLAILDEYGDTSDDGRVTKFERRVLDTITAGGEWPGPFTEGPLTIVPVNPEHVPELEDFKAVRLAQGLRMLVGFRHDDRAVIAGALCFRRPEFSRLDAEELALSWGFITTDDDDEAG